MTEAMKLKIVVIDDERSIRETLKWHLEDLGHEVLTASEPTSCDIYNGTLCTQNAPCGHALIIDFQMPKMSGLDFIEFLSARGCKGITANMLIMSGNLYALDRTKASELGCQIVQKPVPFSYLENWLDSVRENIRKGGCTSAHP